MSSQPITGGPNGSSPTAWTPAPGVTPPSPGVHQPSPWARPGTEPYPTGAWLPSDAQQQGSNAWTQSDAQQQGSNAWAQSGPDAPTTTGWAQPGGGAPPTLGFAHLPAGVPGPTWAPAPGTEMTSMMTMPPVQVAPMYAAMPAPLAPAPVAIAAPVAPGPAPMAAPVVAQPVRRRTTTARLVDGLLVISLVVAAGGVGYAVGRQTAPASTTGGGAGGREFSAFGGFPNGGTTPGGGTSPGGTTPGGGTAQVAAPPSGAPVVPNGSTAPGSGDQPTATQAPQGGPTGQQGGFAPGGLGRGGLSGTVSAVDPTTITVATQDGSDLQVTTSDTTTYHQQVAATADAITVGAPVRITVPGAGRPGAFGGGAAATPAADAEATVATEVELLVEAPAATTGGRGGRFGGVTGTVAAIDGSSITVTTADGQQTQVATDASTFWVQQAVVARDAITPGVTVRFTVEGGFGVPGQSQPGQGQPQGDPTASITVSDVEVLLPAS